MILFFLLYVCKAHTLQSYAKKKIKNVSDETVTWQVHCLPSSEKNIPYISLAGYIFFCEKKGVEEEERGRFLNNIGPRMGGQEKSEAHFRSEGEEKVEEKEEGPLLA